MRELTGHKVNGVNDGLNITVVDEPGSGGANHQYQIAWPLSDSEPTAYPEQYDRVDICFQNGPIKEVGTNGVTHEVLLEIIKDRLIGFQSGPFACADNAKALDHIMAAQECLLNRTKVRAARGVEGTHTV